MTDSSAEAGKAPLQFRNRDALEAWLKTQPSEVSVVIAARVSLRILPLAASAYRHDANEEQARLFARLIQAVFRTTARAWVAGTYPIHVSDTAPAAAQSDAAVARTAEAIAAAAAQSAAATAGPLTRVTLASIAVGPAMAAIRTANAAIRADAITAVRATDTPAVYAARLATAAAANDAEWIAGGDSARELASRPLWPEGTPDSVALSWQSLSDILAPDRHWKVLLDWYRSRLDGRSRPESIELVYARTPQELWDEPAKENEWIAAEIERLEHPEAPRDAIAGLPPIEAIPLQSGAATRFSTETNRPIDVARDPPSHARSRDDEQRILYSETRYKAQVLRGLSDNELGELKTPAARCLEALPEDIALVSISFLWSRANTLRTKLKAHDLAVERHKGVREPEPDPSLLPIGAAETLRDFVESYNLFIVHDPEGCEYDEKRLGPGEADDTRIALEAASTIADNLASAPDVATAAARESLAEQIAAAPAEPKGVHDEQAAALARDSASNFVVELLRRGHKVVGAEMGTAWKGVREGAYRGVGAAVAGGTVIASWPGIVKFIADNAEALKRFVAAVYHNPALEQIIDVVRRLPH